MNKVFKVIWSEARNAYVVVSEMAKSHGTKSCSTKKLLAMLIATGVMTCASMAPAMAKNLTDTQTPPKMIGYQQKWNTDVAKGLLETSINGYQYQGNSLQLNMLQFKKFTTQKGENALHITLGAYVDGVNKNASINFVDTNTKNQTLTTTIKGSVINTVLTDTDNNKVESSVDIGSYVGQEVKKAKTEVKAGENVTSVVKETGANGQDIYTINAKDTTYAAGNGIVINGENNAISVKLKEGESNLQVTDAGLELKKDLTVNSVNAGDYFFDAERGVGFGGEAYVTQSGLNANNKVITNVAAGVADTDAVNVGQLNAAVQAGNTDTHIEPGEYGVGADNTVNMDVVDKNGNKVDTVTIKDVAKASDVGNVNNIAADLKNKEGKTTVVDAVNNLNNKVGDLQYSKVEKGEIADGDSTTTAIGKLDQKLTDVEATAAKHTKVEGSSNITVANTAKEGEAANYKVELNKDIDVDTVKANSVTTG